jgi:hypothetical protein
VYTTLDDKVAAVDAALHRLDASPERVRSLTNWSWIDTALSTLPAPLAA